MKFEVDMHENGNTAVARVLGELDIATTPRLRATVEAADPTADLVIDLTSAAFIDSTACREFVRLAKASAAGGRGMHVVCPEANYEVWRVLDLLGLLEVLGVRPSIDEA